MDHKGRRQAEVEGEVVECVVVDGQDIEVGAVVEQGEPVYRLCAETGRQEVGMVKLTGEDLPYSVSGTVKCQGKMGGYVAGANKRNVIELFEFIILSDC